MSAFKRISQKIQQLDNKIQQSPYGQTVNKLQNAVNFIPKQAGSYLYNNYIYDKSQNRPLPASPYWQVADSNNPNLTPQQRQQALTNLSMGMAGSVSAPKFTGRMGSQLRFSPNKVMDPRTVDIVDNTVEAINRNRDMSAAQYEDLVGALRGITNTPKQKIYDLTPNQLINENMRHANVSDDFYHAPKPIPEYTIDTMPRLLNPFTRK